jgi:hypothetical protein
MVMFFHDGIIVSAPTGEADHPDAPLESELFEVPVYRTEADPRSSTTHSLQNLVGRGVVG